MWDYDTTSGQLWWNARLREQLGYPAHAAPDVGWALAHLSDADGQKVRALWASRPGEPFCTEVSWQRGAASRRLRCRGRVEYGPSGEPRRAVGVVADISDVRRLEAERGQVASELADSVVRDLAASSIYTETAQMRDRAADAPQRREALGALSQHLRRARHELQSIIRGLRFDTIALRTSLKHLLSDEQASSRFELTVDDFDTVDVDGAAGHAAFVIVREALDNVARHANAAHVSVRLSHDALTAYVVVEDNGDGFLTGDITEGRGLSAMRERARTHGGNVELDSQPGRGTRVLLTLPVQSGPSGLAPSTNTPNEKPTGDP
jgi:two-component system sensor histidine kinase UhpB